MEPASTEGGDWLDTAWRALSERWRAILTRRLDGDTLETIAQDLALSRERVRQIQKKAEDALLDAQQSSAPDLVDQLVTELGDLLGIPDEKISAMLPTRASEARAVLLGRLGLNRPVSWAGPIGGYWSRRGDAFNEQLRALVDLAPMTADEAERAADELGLPPALSWSDLLAQPGSRLTRHELGWIRTSRASRDIAYLWLRAQGEPRSAGEIASVTGGSEHAIRENMRRDEAFAQVRPEGTWALVDWRVPGADSRYTNAVDVVVEVLRDLGPMDFEHLKVESQRRYPVSEWRITQCLSSNLIGINDQGLYDLAERGAIPVEDPEPKRPKNMHASGDVVGVELTVNHDLLRGSGIPVNRWLTWYLGLRTAPSARYFDLPEGFGALTVKRATSNSQLSSLRAVAQSLGVVDGCKLTLLLHVDSGGASVRHTCPPRDCPATQQTPPG